MHTEEQFKWIKEIHDLLADSRKNYKATAQIVDDDRVKDVLLRISSERATMEAELAQDLIQHDPQDQPANGTLGGSVHRAMLTVRDVLNNTSEVNMLVECERLDSELLGKYTDVLDTMELNEATRATMARQYGELEQHLHHIAETRESLEGVVH